MLSKRKAVGLGTDPLPRPAFILCGSWRTKRMLSPRLLKLAELAVGSARFWDVGSDHGKLPAWLLLNHHVGFAVASDLRQSPLDRARRTAKACNVDHKMKFVLCDGLNWSDGIGFNAIETDAIGGDTIAIAGMGGETIAEILKPAHWVRERSVRLLLQPMSSVEDLRAYLYEGEYTISAEYLVQETERLYLIIDAKGGGQPESYDLADTRIGKHLVKDAAFRSYADKEIRRLRKELDGLLSSKAKSAACDPNEMISMEDYEHKKQDIMKAIRKIETAKGATIDEYRA